jgi:hypothetical protein
MDFLGAISRIYNLYIKIEKIYPSISNFGFSIQRYDTSRGPGVLYIIMTPPSRKGKGKHRDFEAVLQKSASSAKLILPRDFIPIEQYLTSIFEQITKPRDEVLNELRLLLAGLRLEFVPHQNLKLGFRDPSNIQIVVWDKEDKDGFFAFYINILDLKEDGLYLAHERQVSFIIHEIKAGRDPKTIANLPPLRTGETALQAKKSHSPPSNSISSSTGNEGSNSSANKRDILKQLIKQRAEQDVIKKEMTSETVIKNFSPQSSSVANPIESIVHNESPKPAPLQFNLFGRPTPMHSPSSKISFSKETEEKSTPSIQNHLKVASPILNPVPFPQVPIDHQEPFSPTLPESSKSEGVNSLVAAIQESSRQEIEKIREKLQAIEAQNNALLLQIKTITETYEKQIEVKDQELTQFKQLFSQSDQEKEAYKKLIADFQAKNQECQDLNQRYSNLQEQIQFVNEQNRKTQDLLTKQQQVIITISKKNATLDDAIETLMKEKENLTTQLQSSAVFPSGLPEDIIQEITDENEQLTKTLEETDLRIETLELENNNLKARLAAVEDIAAVEEPEEKKDQSKNI